MELVCLWVAGGSGWRKEEEISGIYVYEAERKKWHMRMYFLEAGDGEHHICTTLNST